MGRRKTVCHGEGIAGGGLVSSLDSNIIATIIAAYAWLSRRLARTDIVTLNGANRRASISTVDVIIITGILKDPSVSTGLFASHGVEGNFITIAAEHICCWSCADCKGNWRGSCSAEYGRVLEQD